MRLKQFFSSTRTWFYSLKNDGCKGDYYALRFKNSDLAELFKQVFNGIVKDLARQETAEPVKETPSELVVARIFSDASVGLKAIEAAKEPVQEVTQKSSNFSKSVFNEKARIYEWIVSTKDDKGNKLTKSRWKEKYFGKVSTHKFEQLILQFSLLPEF